MAGAQHQTLRVGITGHRPNKLARTDAPRMERQLRDVYTAVDAIARASGCEDLVLVSSFAEGADQIAVAACPHDWTVEAILPFSKDEYLKDFVQSAAGDGRDVRGAFLASLARAASVTELAPRPGPRHAGYLAAGLAMLSRIGLLTAVWNGRPPEPGGTGAIVEEACARKIPVVWIASNLDREPVLIERFENGSAVVSHTPWTTALSLTARPTRARPA